MSRSARLAGPVGARSGKRLVTLKASSPVTIQRLERGLIFLAHIIEMDGDVYLPLFEMLEKELAELRRVGEVLDRARVLRETYTIEGHMKKPPEP